MVLGTDYCYAGVPLTLLPALDTHTRVVLDTGISIV